MFKDKLEDNFLDKDVWKVKNFVYIFIVLFGSSIMIIGIQHCENENIKKCESNRLGKYNKIRRM